MPSYIEIDDAARRLQSARRVMVIGCSGGGKSTLSRIIAAHYGLDYISLDREVFWLPGWNMRDRQEQRQRIAGIAARERWIMDGTNPSSFDLRLPRTNLVIWVRMPRFLCLKGVILRWLKYAGRTRPEMAPGCPERLEWDFLRYIWTFERVFTPRVIAALDAHGLMCRLWH